MRERSNSSTWNSEPRTELAGQISWIGPRNFLVAVFRGLLSSPVALSRHWTTSGLARDLPHGLACLRRVGFAMIARGRLPKTLDTLQLSASLWIGPASSLAVGPLAEAGWRVSPPTRLH